MSTAVADIILRAQGMSVANNAPAMTANASEMLSVVAAWERDIFRVAAKESRFFYSETTVTSSTGAGSRTATLGPVSPPVERVVRVLLPSGVMLRQVDFEDQGAELAPRYYVFGQTMYEVGSEWGPTGTVALTVGYAEAPVPLVLTGSTAQTVTLPDAYTDLLVIRLGHYLAVKDTGRDPNEAAALMDTYTRRLADVMNALDHFEGVVRRRFLSPYQIPGGSE